MSNWETRNFDFIGYNVTLYEDHLKWEVRLGRGSVTERYYKDMISAEYRLTEPNWRGFRKIDVYIYLSNDTIHVHEDQLRNTKRINDWIEIVDIVNERIDVFKRKAQSENDTMLAAATAQSTIVPQEKSPAEQIKEFKELYDLGIITEQEFNAKKKQLLGL